MPKRRPRKRKMIWVKVSKKLYDKIKAGKITKLRLGKKMHIKEGDILAIYVQGMTDALKRTAKKVRFSFMPAHVKVIFTGKKKEK